MKNYTITINGVEHTLQLDEADAKRLGATEVKTPAAKASTPANKSRTASNK